MKRERINGDCPVCGRGISAEGTRFSCGAVERRCGMWEGSDPQACGSVWVSFLGAAWPPTAWDQAAEIAFRGDVPPETLLKWARTSAFMAWVRETGRPVATYRGSEYPRQQGRVLFE